MISLSTISFFTYIVYVVANRILVIQMHIKFLVLCACCALLISLILPRIFVGLMGLAGTLGIVILFALFSSYCIAYYYDYTMKKTKTQNVIVANPVEIIDRLLADNKEIVKLITILNEMILIKNLASSKSVVELTETTTTITESVAKKYFYPVKYDELNKKNKIVENDIIKQQHSESLLNNTMKINKGVKVFKIFMNFKNKLHIMNTPLMLKTIHQHLETPVSNEMAIIYEENLDEIAGPTTIAEDSFPSSNELDVLMDFAFLQKEQRNFYQALKVFRQALQLYPDSEVVPFLVMEIGTILKLLGSYNEAIEVFTEGRLLPGVMSNSMLEQEFINNVAYLRIVKNILVKTSLKFMPFNDIPRKIFNEIDSEFSEWRNQSNL